MAETLSDYRIDRWNLDLKAALEQLDASRFSQRLAEKDVTLWPGSDSKRGTGLDRLGWIDAPSRAAEALESWRGQLEPLLAKNPSRVFVMGMGGSSVFPGALSALYAAGRAKGRSLILVDNFFPATLSPLMELLAAPDSLIVVASKSGSTLETAVMATLAESVGAASRMVAITDPGTALEERARLNGYGAIIHGFPDVGGRFSALTAFGIIPALLLGDPVDGILASGNAMRERCLAAKSAAENPGAVLGAAIASAWKAGREVFDIFSARSSGGFNGWVEQLVSESLGKEKVGVWPRGRLDDSLRPSGLSDELAGMVIRESDGRDGSGMLTWSVPMAADLGAEVFRWEVATAAAATLMEIPPFTEPDVAVAKKLTKGASERLSRGEGQSWSEKIVRDGAWSFASPKGAATEVASSFKSFLQEPRDGEAAISLLIYLPNTPKASCAVYGAANLLEEAFSLPVFLGFGPQYLHATGQLHKGGSDRASHIVLTFDAVEADNVPAHDGVDIGALALAQGLADVEALSSRGRNVFHLHFHGESAVAAAAFVDLAEGVSKGE